MHDEQNLKGLSNEEIILRIKDLRGTMQTVLNYNTLELLEEAERRLGGGGPLTPFEQLSKQEQKLRKRYEGYKEFYGRSKYFHHTPMENYTEWNISNARIEKEVRQRIRTTNKLLNDTFQNRIEKYLKKYDNKIALPANHAFTDQDYDVAGIEIDILKSNKRSRQLLEDVLQIQNVKAPTWDEKLKYWSVVKYENETMKKKKIRS